MSNQPASLLMAPIKTVEVMSYIGINNGEFLIKRGVRQHKLASDSR